MSVSLCSYVCIYGHVCTYVCIRVVLRLRIVGVFRITTRLYNLAPVALTTSPTYARTTKRRDIVVMVMRAFSFTIEGITNPVCCSAAREEVS